LLQIRLDGTLKVVQDEKEVKRLFQKVSEKSIKDYTTSVPPGSAIDNPDQVDYVPRSENNFVALKFVPHTIEYLRLKRPNHLRAVFKAEDDWKGQWLVP
jgi:hypothetical protein